MIFARKLIQACLMTCGLLAPLELLAGEKFSFGAGLGSLYSGLGVNLGMRSGHDFKYVSIGCVGYSDRSGKVCGAGAGWVKTRAC